MTIGRTNGKRECFGEDPRGPLELKDQRRGEWFIFSGRSYVKTKTG